jgi:hypothetical protein
MKLLSSHEKYIKSVLEDLFYNKLDIEYNWDSGNTNKTIATANNKNKTSANNNNTT